MKILRAQHLGMCFGVRDALQLALDTAQRRPVTILGDLVHNEQVLDQLRRQGIRVHRLDDPPPVDEVMITAHGTSDRRRAELRGRGLRVLEATCPLVHAAHQAVLRLAREGYHVVIVGQANHTEVRGLTGDLDAFDVVLEESDILRLAERPRFGVAAQTTQPVERVRWLAGRIRQRFPGSEVRLVDTVCQPTKLRQHAAEDLARQCEVLLVIGGAQSNNTRELVATCRRHCRRVFHIQTPQELQESWFERAEVVGLTAGTSTPDAAIDAVEARVQELTRRAAEQPVPPAAIPHHV